MSKLLKFSAIVLLPTLFLAGCVIAEPTEQTHHHHRANNQSEEVQSSSSYQVGQQIDESIDCSRPLPVDAVNSQIDAYDSQCN